MTDEQRIAVEVASRASKKQEHTRVQRVAMLGLSLDAPREEIARVWHLHQRTNRKRVLNEFKRRPCMDCGQRHPPVCMDFDHRPDEEKVRDISKLVMNCNLDGLLEEIGKCDLICSNCHRIRTYKRLLVEQGREDDSGGLETQNGDVQ